MLKTQQKLMAVISCTLRHELNKRRQKRMKDVLCQMGQGMWKRSFVAPTLVSTLGFWITMSSGHLQIASCATRTRQTNHPKQNLQNCIEPFCYPKRRFYLMYAMHRSAPERQYRDGSPRNPAIEKRKRCGGGGAYGSRRCAFSPGRFESVVGVR